MHFISTRDENNFSTLSEAIRCGLASDGGLFVPAHIPRIDLSRLTTDLTYNQCAQRLLQEYFIGDKLNDNLMEICEEAFTFLIPLSDVNDNTYMLELYHGPTSSFKDVGARFLASCLSRLKVQKKLTIMVATSGDTGSAVASAFYQNPNINLFGYNKLINFGI